MTIYEAIARIFAEVLVLCGALFDRWVSVPANVEGPLDTNATLTTSGTELVEHLATAAAVASNILCDMVGALFPTPG